MFVARKPTKVLGRRYAAGEEVPLGEFPPGVRKRLLEYRRVVPRDVSPAPGVQAPSPETKTMTCGAYGGRTKNGDPCSNAVDGPGRCRWHRE